MKTLIVLGSGGHTAEMLALVSKLDPQKYYPRAYVVAETDKMGARKAQWSEEHMLRVQEAVVNANAEVCLVPRSREVGQSYSTSVWTTIVAMWAACALVLEQAPDLVLVNGPGTCVPICLAARILRKVKPWRGQVVYVESIARVTSLSLSGKILYWLRIADLFLVQWPDLQKQCKRARYCGRLF